MLMEPGKTELDTARRLTAGALAGLVSVACTYPLDIVRTRLAVQSATLSGKMSAANTKLPGIMPTMIQIYRTEGGLFGLYRGLWPTLLVINTLHVHDFSHTH
jgi:solute carrier family 25 phosphate transporter 23/24/25/41